MNISELMMNISGFSDWMHFVKFFTLQKVLKLFHQYGNIFWTWRDKTSDINWAVSILWMSRFVFHGGRPLEGAWEPTRLGILSYIDLHYQGRLDPEFDDVSS